MATLTLNVSLSKYTIIRFLTWLVRTSPFDLRLKTLLLRAVNPHPRSVPPCSRPSTPSFTTEANATFINPANALDQLYTYPYIVMWDVRTSEQPHQCHQPGQHDHPGFGLRKSQCRLHRRARIRHLQPFTTCGEMGRLSSNLQVVYELT